MWSAAPQDVERFAVDSVADAAECKAPSCRTDSVVESQFKSVKHGRLERQTVVRETAAFVTVELTYILGKLNEKKFPEVQRKTTA